MNWRHVICCAALSLLACYALRDLAACRGRCVIDAREFVHNVGPGSELHLPDTRLNAWILAWVQHALLSQPRALFDANIFHPAPNALSGSEHMLSTAILTLPLRAFTDDAVLIYNLALFASFALTGVAYYALLIWATGNTGVALFAGAAAMLMPWRFAELSHIQLLNLQWAPLCWLFIGRLFLVRPSRSNALGLFLVLLIQLYAAYYLAYYTLTSLVVIAGVMYLRGHRRPAALGYTAASVVAAAGLLAMTSLAYLDRSGAREIVVRGRPILDAGIAAAFAALAPDALRSDPTTANYGIPLVLMMLAAFALISLMMPFRGIRNAADDGRARELVVAMIACAAVCFVMMIGTGITLGAVRIPLPAGLAADLLPGFGNLRAPLRWGIMVCATVPVLAALGLSRVLESVVERRLAGAIPVVAALVLSWSILPVSLPTTNASRLAGLRAYDEVAKLPRGPLLEIPWAVHPVTNALDSSEYMLASTRHWHPILNGYTAYQPDVYEFLTRVGTRLPASDSLGHLVDLTGLRWIVVHKDKLAPGMVELWNDRRFDGSLTQTYSDADVDIFEVVEWESGGSKIEDLFEIGTPSRTLTGLSREPLPVHARKGALGTRMAERIVMYGKSWSRMEVTVRITNESSQDWPGLDRHSEGLVALNFRVVRDGRLAFSELVMLDGDIPAGGTLATRVFVGGHTSPGTHVVEAELVQILGDKAVSLGLPLDRQQVDLAVPG